MKIDGVAHRSIWPAEHGRSVHIIDQTQLPHRFVTTELTTPEAAATAIRDMWVRGAPLIGATAAYGLAMALARDPSDAGLAQAAAQLAATRPTAINLRWALDAVTASVAPLPESARAAAAWAKAGEICDEDVEVNHAIGRHGLTLIREIAARKNQGKGGGKGGGEPVNILTHCNAGWLATVDWGTATSPIYQAHDAGIPVHVWVDETRPRNQGAGLTAWELGRHGVSHRLVVDNAGGHLMQHGLVDMVIVGTDRTTATGDVCNKIGTYLKALAAHDNGVPFHVALPSSTIDWTVSDGLREIPIEERSGREVTHLTGLTEDGRSETIAITPPTTEATNPAFDVTPARLVTSLITERGICAASADGLASLFPERRAAS